MRPPRPQHLPGQPTAWTPGGWIPAQSGAGAGGRWGLAQGPVSQEVQVRVVSAVALGGPSRQAHPSLHPPGVTPSGLCARLDLTEASHASVPQTKLLGAHSPCPSSSQDPGDTLSLSP